MYRTGPETDSGALFPRTGIRGPMYSSLEGHGCAPAIEDYPFQGLDIPACQYGPWLWLLQAETSAMVMATIGARGVNSATPAGDCKHHGRSPFGTGLGAIARRELGMPVQGGWADAGDAWRQGDAYGPDV